MTLRAGLAGAAIVLLAVASCGVPDDPTVQPVGPVPYDLAAPSPTPQPTEAADPSQGPRVYFVSGDALVPTAGPVRSSSPTGTVEALLAALVGGPSEADRSGGLSTALGADVAVSLTSVDAGRATIDIRAGQLPTGAGRLPLAVGQLVLTVTSVVDVSEVVLTSDGVGIPAPLPGGALTDRPLTADDYSDLLKASPP